MTESISTETAPLSTAGLSISRTKGQPHTASRQLRITANGIEGDRHAGPGLRQISLMHREVAASFFPDASGSELPGKGQENILVEGEGLAAIKILDTLEVGEALLEVTRIGKRVNETGVSLCSASNQCLLSDFGVFARVLHGGTVAEGYSIRHQQRLLRAHVITVSDRASNGEYEDQSGPAVTELLEVWCKKNHWTLWVETRIIPDDADAIEMVLDHARQSGVDVVITTGGTGVAPRDITPDVVTKLADRTIPGIMDFIRMKYGEKMPMALTSRSVAAVMGTSLIYTLPGNVRAIPEYLEEIFKTMEHMLLLLKGLDAH